MDKGTPKRNVRTYRCNRGKDTRLASELFVVDGVVPTYSYRPREHHNAKLLNNAPLTDAKPVPVDRSPTIQPQPGVESLVYDRVARTGKEMGELHRIRAFVYDEAAHSEEEATKEV